MVAPNMKLERAQERLIRKHWGNADVSVEAIATLTSLKVQRVRKFARDLGLPSRGRPAFDWASAPAALKGWYESGVAAAEIARRLDPSGALTAAAVGSYAKRCEWTVPERNCGAPPPPNPWASPGRSVAVRRADAVAPEGAKVLADHLAGECLWPVGPDPTIDMSLQAFCCQPVEAGGARYCKSHATRAFDRAKAA